jgi:hypothetical protein
MTPFYEAGSPKDNLPKSSLFQNQAARVEGTPLRHSLANVAEGFLPSATLRFWMAIFGSQD